MRVLTYSDLEGNDTVFEQLSFERLLWLTDLFSRRLDNDDYLLDTKDVDSNLVLVFTYALAQCIHSQRKQAAGNDTRMISESIHFLPFAAAMCMSHAGPNRASNCLMRKDLRFVLGRTGAAKDGERLSHCELDGYTASGSMTFSPLDTNEFLNAN